jgi:O-antigen ligase
MGIFFVWNLLQAGTIKKSRTRLEERALSILFLGMIVWLLHMCNSATSQVCLATGVGMMFLLKARWLNKRYLGTVLITGVVAYVVLDSTFDIYANTLKMLGRKPSLTDRTEVWADALALVEDPVLGAGFESFWLGDRLKKMWAKWHWQPTQAHSGYIETYLNLGFIGVGLLLIVAVTTFKKIQKALLVDFQMGQLRMGYFVALWLYNYTEAAFKGVSLVWLVFHIIAMDYPRLKRAVKVSSPKLDPRMVPQRQGGYP